MLIYNKRAGIRISDGIHIEKTDIRTRTNHLASCGRGHECHLDSSGRPAFGPEWPSDPLISSIADRTLPEGSPQLSEVVYKHRECRQLDCSLGTEKKLWIDLEPDPEESGGMGDAHPRHLNERVSGQDDREFSERGVLNRS
jgi:hypothetical protein